MHSFRFLFFRATEELTEHISHHSSKESNDSELTTYRCTSPNEPVTPTDTKYLREKERGEIVGEGGERDSSETERVENVRDTEVRSRREDGEESKVEEREKDGECDQMWETELKRLERQFNERETKEVDGEFGEMRETESGEEDEREEEDEGVERLMRDFNEDGVEEREERASQELSGVERSIQVMDGHIALGTVQWRERQAKAAGRLQVKSTDVPFCI